MDHQAFKEAIKSLVEEKGISEDLLYETMELALTSAYKKNYKSLSNVRVDINRGTGDIKVFSFKTVVDPNTTIEVVVDQTLEGEDIKEEIPFPFDERIHFTLAEAKKIKKDIKMGETIETEVTPKDFGRVAASTAKQVVIQKIREAERDLINTEYGEKEGELVIGRVAMEDVRNYYIDLGRIQGILPKAEIIPGEIIAMNSQLKVYITKVESGTKGTLILLSRNHYGFVKRLFELEIPEVNEGLVLFYSIAREPGIRTKIAVYSDNTNIDPVGACIGEKGSRINKVIKELNGEKIDVIRYDKDPETFVKNALSPARNLQVYIVEENKAFVVVADDDFSLAIGKKGANVRLASRLTKHKIDIKSHSQAKEEGINIIVD